jgi:hypothetical protein
VIRVPMSKTNMVRYLPTFIPSVPLNSGMT